VRGIFRIGIVATGAFVTVALVAMVSWPTVNQVTTGQTPEYPDVQPQALRYSPDLVYQRAIETVRELDNWRLAAHSDEPERTIHAIHSNDLLPWVDEVIIRVEPLGAGSLVFMSSSSRSGRGDFGQNTRNIELFQQALVTNLELARQVED